MKKMNNLFFLLATMIVAIGFSGCSDDDGPGIEIVPPTVVPGDKVDNPSQVEFTLDLSGVKQIAYEVVEGHEANATTRGSKEENERGALIFKNAQLEGGSGIIEAVNGANTVVVKNLEGNKDYTVYFAFKIGEESYEVEARNFTTPGYSKVLTVLSTSVDGFKIHIEVPDSVHYRWGYSDAALYHDMAQFGTDDMTRMEYNGNQWLKGPQTLEIKNGEEWYSVDNYGEMETYYHQILPGNSYIFLIAECDEEGTLNYTVEGWDDGGWDDWGPMMNELPYVHDNYTETWESDYITFDGIYAKVQLDVKAPELVQSQLLIEKVMHTERRALFNITPSNDTKQLAVTILEKSQYEMLKSWVGENALKWVGLNYVAGMSTEAVPVEVTGLSPETSYKLLVYGAYTDDSMVMSYEEIDVEYVPSTNPDANLVVEPLSVERIKELGYDPAYMVGFNVKCPDANATGVKYIANYAADWDEQLNWGYTDADILTYYGVDVFEADDPDFIKGVNSAEGFDVTFTCTEKTEMVMAIAGYNVDEKQSDVVVARVTSAEQWGENPIESPLFTELAGDWTATYKYERHFVDENWEAQTETLEKTFKVTIADGIDAGPAEMDEETYNTLVNYYVENGDDEATAKAKVEGNFADFKEKAAHYSAKYRSLNRMIMTGFEPLHAYKSAWDLAIDLDHSAVDNDDLFYDFGPKMFLEISESGATLNSNLESFPPVSSWYKDGYYTREYYLLGCNGEDYLGDVAFPIEISDDKQSMTIKAMDGGYYPSIGYTTYGWSWGASFAALGLSEIQLTKGWNGPEEVKTRVATINKDQKINARRGANRFVKTKLPQSKEAVSFKNKMTIDATEVAKKMEKETAKRKQMMEQMKKK